MVTIFGNGDCSFFDKTKLLISMSGCEFVAIDVTQNTQAAAFLNDLLDTYVTHKSNHNNTSTCTDSSEASLQQGQPAAPPDLLLPLVFFGDTYAGEFKDLCVLFEDNKIEEMYERCAYTHTDSKVYTNAQKYMSEFQAMGVPNLVQKFTQVFDCKKNEDEQHIYTYKYMLYTCIQELTLKYKKMVKFNILQKCFEGKTLVNFCRRKFNIEETEAIQFCKDIYKYDTIHDVQDKNKFDDSETLYRFYAEDNCLILNHIVRVDGIETEALHANDVVKYCRMQLTKLKRTHRDSDGKPDYIAMQMGEAYFDLELATCALQNVQIQKLNQNERKSFFLNVYNMMLTHAIIKFGAPTKLTRNNFYDIAYIIGGVCMTCHDILNFVLRGKTRNGVKTVCREIRPYVLTSPDFRIHFALNYETKSSPPAMWFTPDYIDEELDIVTSFMLNREDMVCIDTANKKLTLSKIFSWYKRDFGSDIRVVGDLLSPYMKTNKQSDMHTLLNAPFKTVYHKYDWEVEAHRKRTFSLKTVLQNNPSASGGAAAGAAMAAYVAC